jgi:hypothetical protein
MAADGLPALSTTVTLTGSARGDRALPAQQGMILNNMRFPDDGVDVLQVTLDWKAPLQREPFEAAWHATAQRHPVLRTPFRLDDSGATWTKITKLGTAPPSSICPGSAGALPACHKWTFCAVSTSTGFR